MHTRMKQYWYKATVRGDKVTNTGAIYYSYTTERGHRWALDAHDASEKIQDSYEYAKTVIENLEIREQNKYGNVLIACAVMSDKDPKLVDILPLYGYKRPEEKTEGKDIYPENKYGYLTRAYTKLAPYYTTYSGEQRP